MENVPYLSAFRNAAEGRWNEINADNPVGELWLFYLVCALSMGNRMYLLLALLIIIAWVLAYISIAWLRNPSVFRTG